MEDFFHKDEIFEFMLDPYSTTYEDIQKLQQNLIPESDVLDYKKDITKTWWKHASAFLNAGGGQLVFGVEEKYLVPTKIVGVNRMDVENYSKPPNNLKPRLDGQCYLLKHINLPEDTNKEILLVTLINSKEEIYIYDNKLYIRKGHESKHISDFVQLIRHEIHKFRLKGNMNQFIGKIHNNELFSQLISKLKLNVTSKNVNWTLYYLERIRRNEYSTFFIPNEDFFNIILEAIDFLKNEEYTDYLHIGFLHNLIQDPYINDKIKDNFFNFISKLKSKIESLLQEEFEDIAKIGIYNTDFIKILIESIPNSYLEINDKELLKKIILWYHYSKLRINSTFRKTLEYYREQNPLEFENLLEELKIIDDSIDIDF